MTFDDNNFPQSDAARVPDPATAPEPHRPRLEASVTPGYLGPTLRHVPEDLRVPWGWLDLLLLVVIGFAGLLLSSLLVLTAFVAVGITMNQIKHSIVDQSLFSVIATCLISIALLVYLLAQMR